MIENYIDKLIGYALEKKLIEKEDEILCRNRILEILGLDEYIECEDDGKTLELWQILEGICDFAVEKGILTDTVTLIASRQKKFAEYAEIDHGATTGITAMSRNYILARFQQSEHIVFQFLPDIQALTVAWE